ncbi:hypothetical protein [Butyrivibrio sp. FCS014]|uniref:hypothetical protein n=1 Tax=Butyrivibrio sp. FCS014 TaxID=1408304 RepID=UPI000466E851|nr:hypothetical protein [Butyrivibrio sp. FCS014]
MNERSNSKLSLFLMELIIAIMFFSLSAAVCVRLFVSAHTMAESTESINNATIWTQNLAEAFTGEKGDLSEISHLFPEAYVISESETEGTLILFFDDKWELMSGQPSDAAYEAILEVTRQDAADVYSDVNTYGTEITGKAAVGKIAVMKTGSSADIVSVIPDDGADVILLTAVDTYLGKEGQ